MTPKALITALLGWAVIFPVFPAFCRDVELIWPEPQKSGTTICYSRYRNNQWSAKSILAAGNGLKVTPAVASTEKRNMAIWVDVTEQGKLSFTYLTGNNGTWHSPQVFHSDFQETTAPALISYDRRFSLFFAGNHGDDDDIYMAVFDHDTWTAPVMVHQDNNVPDILPEPQIVKGALTVKWQHFDGERYIYQSQKLFDRSENSAGRTSRWQRFQQAEPLNAPGIKLNKNSIGILKEKFDVDLPVDFKGIGLIRAYIPDDDEMPALHINASPQ